MPFQARTNIRNQIPLPAPNSSALNSPAPNSPAPNSPVPNQPHMLQSSHMVLLYYFLFSFSPEIVWYSTHPHYTYVFHNTYMTHGSLLFQFCQVCTVTPFITLSRLNRNC